MSKASYRSIFHSFFVTTFFFVLLSVVVLIIMQLFMNWKRLRKFPGIYGFVIQCFLKELRWNIRSFIDLFCTFWIFLFTKIALVKQNENKNVKQNIPFFVKLLFCFVLSPSEYVLWLWVFSSSRLFIIQSIHVVVSVLLVNNIMSTCDFITRT